MTGKAVGDLAFHGLLWAVIPRAFPHFHECVLFRFCWSPHWHSKLMGHVMTTSDYPPGHLVLCWRSGFSWALLDHLWGSLPCPSFVSVMVMVCELHLHPFFLAGDVCIDNSLSLFLFGFWFGAVWSMRSVPAIFSTVGRVCHHGAWASGAVVSPLDPGGIAASW